MTLSLEIKKLWELKQKIARSHRFSQAHDLRINFIFYHGLTLQLHVDLRVMPCAGGHGWGLGFSGLCVFSWSKMEMESVLKNPYKSKFFQRKCKNLPKKHKKCHRCHGNKMATASRVTFGTMVIIHGDREVPIACRES